MKKIAVYAGTFDPPTLGHLDVISRVQPLFDKLILVVAHNIRKQTLFSAEERKSLLAESAQKILPKGSFEVAIHEGLIVDFCKVHNVKVLVRGIRAMSDFEYEFQMSTMNRRLAPKLETLHVMTDERHFFVSSTLVKEVAMHAGDLKSLVPENVRKALETKLRKKRK